MKKSLPIWLAGLAFLLAPQYVSREDGTRRDAPLVVEKRRPAPAAAPPPAEVALAEPRPRTPLPLPLPQAPEVQELPPPPEPEPPPVRRADFGGEQPSADVRHIADWALDSGDHEGQPFAVIDKTGARVFVFDAEGRLQAAAPALLGLAPGDDSVPGIGERPISLIRPHERTTPAGRFVAEPGLNSQGEDVVWVDYEVAVSMHRVRPVDPREKRLERLASPTPEDNRISYGCINLPPEFYDAFVAPLIGARRGIVYVLPETLPPQAVFGSYEVGEPVQRHSAAAATQVAEEAFWRAMMTR